MGLGTSDFIITILVELFYDVRQICLSDSSCQKLRFLRFIHLFIAPLRCYSNAYGQLDCLNMIDR